MLQPQRHLGTEIPPHNIVRLTPFLTTPSEPVTRIHICMKNVEKCYMCEDVATSKEHVPPRCIFPEKKDMPDYNYRKNLITVPSCERHNTSKSTDDQFLLLSLARMVGNNAAGFVHGSTKATRTLNRTPHVIESIFKNKKEVTIDFAGTPRDFVVGHPDTQRLVSCFEKIFYAIYRHHFCKNFQGRIKVFPSFLYSTDKKFNSFKKLIQKTAARDLTNQPILGDNPAIFTYQFTEPDTYGIILCKLVFYENIEVFGSYVIQEPNDLVAMLIKNGIETHFNVDGEEIIINGK